MDRQTFRLNLEAIYDMNQRGDRMLSVPDLVAAGTVPPEYAAYIIKHLREGASLLVASRPNAAGKTTVQAAFLGTVADKYEFEVIESDRSVRAICRHHVSNKRKDPKIYLIHEIGSGRWYGYIWGSSVGNIVKYCLNSGGYIFANMHPDTIEEIYGTFGTFGIGIQEMVFWDFILIIDYRPFEDTRKISEIWKADPDIDSERFGKHRLIYNGKTIGVDILSEQGDNESARKIEKIYTLITEYSSSGPTNIEEFANALHAADV